MNQTQQHKTRSTESGPDVMTVPRQTIVLAKNGHVLRHIAVDPGSDLHLVMDRRTKRMEFVNEWNDNRKIWIQKVSKLPTASFSTVSVGDFELHHTTTAGLEVRVDENVELGGDANARKLAGPVLLAMMVAFLASWVLGDLFGPSPTEEAAVEEPEVKSIEAKIVELKPQPKPVEIPQEIPVQEAKPQPVKPNLKKLGALAVLGRLNGNKNQKGGVNVNAVETSAGAGAGGTQGSGGVQTQFYGKGMIGAALGPGANAQGLGGYGTKGRGGGQAGYGQETLVGSVGDRLVPMSSEATVDGGLDPSVIAAVIERYLGQVRFCYEKGLQQDPGISGRVTVQFVINQNGRLSTRKVKDSTLNSPVVNSCILQKMGSWEFPKPKGGVSVNVSYPFVLKRMGNG